MAGTWVEETPGAESRIHIIGDDGDELIEVDAPSKMTHLQFMGLIGDELFLQFLIAAKGDPVLELFHEKLKMATHLDRSSPDLRKGLTLLSEHPGIDLTLEGVERVLQGLPASGT